MSRGSRRHHALVLCCCFLLVPARLRAQVPTGSQVGVRLDAISSRAATVQFGMTANATAGVYVRLEANVAGGLAWHDGTQYGSARLDALSRFTLDPFLESRRALYGLGGVSMMYDGFERWRPRLLAGFGIEGPVRRGRVMALEVALGGGARVGLVVRRKRTFGR